MSCPFSSSVNHAAIARNLVDLASSSSSTDQSGSSSSSTFRPRQSISSSNHDGDLVAAVSESPTISYWNSIGVPRLGSMPDISFLADAVLIVRNHDYIIIECNNIAVKMFGYIDQADLIGKHINILVPTEYAGTHSKQVASVFGNMKNKSMGGSRQVKGLRADSSEFEVTVQLCPATIQVRGFAHYEKIVTCVCRDVTEHNIAVAARIEADKRNEAMEKFFRLINHEFRTSIHAITNALSTVKADLESYLTNQAEETLTSPTLPITTLENLSKLQVEALAVPLLLQMFNTVPGDEGEGKARLVSYPLAETIPLAASKKLIQTVLNDESSRSSPKSALRSLNLLEQGVSSMETLLSNMLDFRSLSDGNLNVQYSVINCGSLLAALKSSQKARWRPKSQEVVVSVEPSVPIIYLDAQLLTKVLNCLFDNALRHTVDHTKILLSCAIKPEKSSYAEWISHRSSVVSNSSVSSPVVLHRANSHSAYSSPIRKKLNDAATQFNSLLQQTCLKGFRSKSVPPTLTSYYRPVYRETLPILESSPVLIDPPEPLTSPIIESEINLSFESPDKAYELKQCVLEFRVCDNGEGLSHLSLRELENDTLQADGSSTRATNGGLGLGLKIAKLCAQQLNATLEFISSDSDQRNSNTWKTMFLLTVTAPIVQLPVSSSDSFKATNAAVFLSTTDKTPKKGAYNSIDEEFQLFSSREMQQEMVHNLLNSSFKEQRSQMKILIVEDNLVNIKVLKQCLMKRGFKSLTTAGNGQQAVEESMKCKFDLILMDLEMPIKDGLSASKEIRDDRNNSNICTPIIALTANATSVAQIKCAEAGMNLYLTKPLNAMDLMFSIAALKPFELYQLQYCPHILLYSGQTSLHAVPPELA